MGFCQIFLVSAVNCSLARSLSLSCLPSFKVHELSLNSVSHAHQKNQRKKESCELWPPLTKAQQALKYELFKFRSMRSFQTKMPAKLFQDGFRADETTLKDLLPDLVHSETLRGLIKLIFDTESGRENLEREMSNRKICWPDGSLMKAIDKKRFGNKGLKRPFFRTSGELLLFWGPWIDPEQKLLTIISKNSIFRVIY